MSQQHKMRENYLVLLEYDDLVSITFMINPILNLISEIYYERERIEHHVAVLKEHLIIIPKRVGWPTVKPVRLVRVMTLPKTSTP